MKQSIDSKQLKELSFRQVKKLGEMSGLVSYPRTEKEWEERQTREHLTMYISLMQWINIGKMIEILKDYRPKISDCLLKGEKYEYLGEGWSVYLQQAPGEIKHFNYTELCDCLWEAVKEIL